MFKVRRVIMQIQKGEAVPLVSLLWGMYDLARNAWILFMADPWVLHPAVDTHCCFVI